MERNRAEGKIVRWRRGIVGLWAAAASVSAPVATALGEAASTTDSTAPPTTVVVSLPPIGPPRSPSFSSTTARPSSPFPSAAQTAATATAGQPEAPPAFVDCAEARRAGRADIPRSDPAYRAVLDGDGDGIACEASESGVLADTGTDAALLAVAGSALMAAGIAWSVTGRHRPRPA